MITRHPYARLAYAEALCADDAAGQAVDVAEWSCAVVTQSVADDARDAAGPYPRTPLRADAELEAGLDALARLGLVSVVLVADPLAAPPAERLGRAFSVCRPFKTHFLVDHARGQATPTKHHRYEIRRANGRCEVVLVRLADRMADWSGLYEGLKQRHQVTGPAAFSAAYFQALAAEPLYETFAAIVQGRVVAMSIWFQHDGVAVNHLGASSQAGYALGASYALYAAALDHYAGAAVLDLGGAAGFGDDPNDGLARFKRGFSNAEAGAYLCGAVLDTARYAALNQDRPPTAFFPAYRAPAGFAQSSTAATTRAMSNAP
jgi:hypothetical protein